MYCDFVQFSLIFSYFFLSKNISLLVPKNFKIYDPAGAVGTQKLGSSAFQRILKVMFMFMFSALKMFTLMIFLCGVMV